MVSVAMMLTVDLLPDRVATDQTKRVKTHAMDDLVRAALQLRVTHLIREMMVSVAMMLTADSPRDHVATDQTKHVKIPAPMGHVEAVVQLRVK